MSKFCANNDLSTFGKTSNTLLLVEYTYTYTYTPAVTHYSSLQEVFDIDGRFSVGQLKLAGYARQLKLAGFLATNESATRGTPELRRLDTY